MQLHIENMTCGGCVRGVTKAIESVDADAKVTADLPNRRVEVQTSATPEQIEGALQEAGFPTQAV